jgi:hypothetical protein
MNLFAAVPVILVMMLRLLASGVSAARHLAWYVSYQVSGETKSRR